MRIIICGSRDFQDYNLAKEIILTALKEFGIDKPTVILSGKAKGADALGEKFAKEYKIPVQPYYAKWKDIEGKDPKYIKENKYGKYYTLAGIERNHLMGDNADAVIAINMETSGTDDMVSYAKKKNLKVYEYLVELKEEDTFTF